MGSLARLIWTYFSSLHIFPSSRLCKEVSKHLASIIGDPSRIVLEEQELRKMGEIKKEKFAIKKKVSHHSLREV